MKTATLLKSYLAVCSIYLLIILLGQENIAWYMKPLLLPFLISAVYVSGRFSSKRLYFIVGLVAFLISHLIYIVLFNKQIKPKNTRNKAVYWVGVTIIIVYLMVMLSVLLPSLGDLKIPVFVYAMVISTMLLFAFKGFLIWHKPANWYILIGAIVFVSSDSILAFDKFYSPIVMSSFFIMITYLLAQYLIVTGILKLNQKK